MIRLLLMALGAYTLYRMYAPLDTSGRPRELLSDMRNRPRDVQRRTARTVRGAGGVRS